MERKCILTFITLATLKLDLDAIMVCFITIMFLCVISQRIPKFSRILRSPVPFIGTILSSFLLSAFLLQFNVSIHPKTTSTIYQIQTIKIAPRSAWAFLHLSPSRTIRLSTINNPWIAELQPMRYIDEQIKIYPRNLGITTGRKVVQWYPLG